MYRPVILFVYLYVVIVILQLNAGTPGAKQIGYKLVKLARVCLAIEAPGFSLNQCIG